MVKNPPANVGDADLTPLSQEDPLKKEMATRFSILAWEMDRGAWRAYSPWDCKELDMTEQLSTHTQSH